MEISIGFSIGQLDAEGKLLPDQVVEGNVVVVAQQFKIETVQL
jgi:hypothetical protein